MNIDLAVSKTAANQNIQFPTTGPVDNAEPVTAFANVMEKVQSGDSAATASTAGSNAEAASATTASGENFALSSSGAAVQASAQQGDSVDMQSMMMMLMMSSMGGSGGMGSMMMMLMMSQIMQGKSSLDLSSLFGSGGVSGVSAAGSVAAATRAGANASGSEILNLAKSRLGDPYSQPKAGSGNYTDCSYLAQWCNKQVGINIPRTAAEQARYCAENNMTVSKEELQPGDLIFFSHGKNGRYKNITHVGIYAGDGMMVDASSSKGQVVYREMIGGQVMYGRPTK